MGKYLDYFDQGTVEPPSPKQSAASQFEGDPALDLYRSNRIRQEEWEAANADIEAVLRQDPDAVKDWGHVAQRLVQLVEDGEDEHRQFAFQALKQYEDKVRPQINLNYGRNWWDENYQAPPGPGILGKTVGVISALGNWLDAANPTPVVEALFEHKDPGGALKELGRGVANFATLDQFDVLETPDKYDARNLREALGMDPGEGGFLGTVLDITGQIILDPITWVGFGASRAAKAAKRGAVDAAKASATSGQGEILENIFKKAEHLGGLDKLTEAEQAIAKYWTVKGTMRSAAAASKYASPSKAARIRAALPGMKKHMDEAASKLDDIFDGAWSKGDQVRVASQLRAIDRSLVPGIRFGGRTLPGSNKIVPEFVTGRKALVASDDIWDISTKAPMTRVQDVSPGLLGDLKATRPARWVSDKFVPRGSFTAPGGAGAAAADDVRAITVEAMGRAGQTSQEITSILNPRGQYVQDAIEEVGSYPIVNQILEDALTQADEAAFKAFRATQPPKMQKVIDAVDHARRLTFEALDEADQAVLNRWNYIPRAMPDAGRENLFDALKTASPSQREELGRLGTIDLDMAAARKSGGFFDPHMQARTFQPQLLKPSEVDNALQGWANSAGVTLKGPVFTTDVMEAVALRSRSAMKARIKADILSGLQDVADDVGVKLLGYQNEVSKITHKMLPGDTGLWAHRDVYDELVNVLDLFGNQNRLDEISGLLQTAESIWGRYALLSPGFHTRNAGTNVVFLGLAGMKNPNRLRQGFAVKRDMTKVFKAMGETGDDFFTAAKGLGFDDATIKLFRELNEYQIVGGRVRDIYRGSKTIGSKNITEVSRRVGTNMEDGFRIGLYLDQVSKGLSPREAARVVKEFLFDYSDLTKFEQDIRRNVSRFYTFFRKNLGLQTNMLLTHPGRMVTTQRITEAFTDEMVNAKEALFGEGGVAPNVPIPFWAQAAAMDWRGGDLIAMDTPLASASQTAESLLAIGTLPFYAFGMEEKFPESIRNAIMYGDRSTKGAQLGDQMRAIWNLSSGFIPSTMDAIYGEMMDQDFFTRGRLSNKAPGIVRALSVFNPAVDRVFRLGEDAGWWAYQDGEFSWPGQESVDESGVVEDRGLMALNWLMGFRVYEGERAEQTALWTLDEMLDEIMGGYEVIHEGAPEEGQIRSVQQLREAGELDFVSAVDKALAFGAPEELLEDMAKIMGQDYMKAMGLISEVSPVSPDPNERAKALRAFEDKIKAYEVFTGEPMSPNQITQAVLMSPWAAEDSWLRDQGIEPYSTSNRYITEEDTGPSDAENWMHLEDLVREAGGDVEWLRRYRPLLDDATRSRIEAQEAGLTEEEWMQSLLQDALTRTQRYVLGVIGDTDYLTDHSMTAADFAREHNLAWELQAVIGYIWMDQYGRPPTLEEIDFYMPYLLSSKGDQEMLSMAEILPGVWPSQKAPLDLQPPTTRLSDIINEVAAQRQGVRGSRIPIPQE